ELLVLVLAEVKPRLGDVADGLRHARVLVRVVAAADFLPPLAVLPQLDRGVEVLLRLLDQVPLAVIDHDLVLRLRAARGLRRRALELALVLERALAGDGHARAVFPLDRARLLPQRLADAHVRGDDVVHARLAAPLAQPLLEMADELV